MGWLAWLQKSGRRAASAEQLQRIAAAHGRDATLSEVTSELEDLHRLGFLHKNPQDSFELRGRLEILDASLLDHLEQGARRYVRRLDRFNSNELTALTEVFDFLIDLHPSRQVMHDLIQEFDREVRNGVAGTGGSLKMLQTFARQPTGREQGSMIVVDWGGTNGRIARVTLNGCGGFKVEQESSFRFEDRHKTAPASEIFDFIVQHIDELLGGDRKHEHWLALIYSFPARMRRLDEAVALQLTKGWRPRGLEGEDVVAILRDALQRRGMNHITVRAVANDTVAPMVLHTYQLKAQDPFAPATDVGLILGTGTNQAIDLGKDGIRNMESGNFDGVRRIQTLVDVALDQEISEPPSGLQLYEKMVSGQYLGEVVRRTLRELRRTTPWFAWNADAMERVFGLDSKFLSQIAADSSEGLEDCAAVLRELSIECSGLERSLLQWITHGVVQRSARLVAVGILGALRSIDHLLERPHCVAIDGSLYGGYPGYDEMLRDAIEELGGAGCAERVKRKFVKNSTSAGAAVIAAVAGGAAEERA